MYLSPVTKGEIWKMKSFKKLLAMLLAVVMVVGVVNLPTKAAGDGSTRDKAIEPTINVGDDMDRTYEFFLEMSDLVVPTGDAYFQPVDTTSVFTFNGEPADMELKMTTLGLQFPVSGMLGKTGNVNATWGDTVTFGGLWRYADGTYYNFPTTTYVYQGYPDNASTDLWVKLPEYQSGVTSVTKVTLQDPGASPHTSANRFFLLTDTITSISGDQYFVPVNEDSVYTFNGETSKIPLKMAGSDLGFQMDVGLMTGGTDNGVPGKVGDIVTFGGVWYCEDNKTFYEFEKVSYICSKTGLGGATTTWVKAGDAGNIEKTFEHNYFNVNNSDHALIISNLTATSDTWYLPVNENSVFTYNGQAPAYNLKIAGPAGIQINTQELTGGSVQLGHFAHFGGVWKNPTDSKYYDFGDQYYVYTTQWNKLGNVPENPTTSTIDNSKVTVHSWTSPTQLFLQNGGLPALNTDAFFVPVDDTASYTYNGEAAHTLPKAAGNQCMQFIVGDMKGTFDTNDTASSGDTIVLDGKWYLGSTGTAYTFDKMTYRYNGSAWCKVFDTTLNQVGINDTNRFFLHYNEIQTTSNMADIFFVAQEGATFTYNGVEVTAMTGLKLTGSGMQFDVGLMTIGTSADNNKPATPGDIVSFQGLWLDSTNNIYYRFAETTYVFNGTNWEAIAPTNVTNVMPELNWKQSGAVYATVTGISLPSSGTTNLYPVNQDSVFYWNGKKAQGLPKLHQSGGLLFDLAAMTGVVGKEAEVGDTVAIDGVWMSANDNTYWNFGKVKYEYQGNNEWKETFDLEHVVNFAVTGVGNCETEIDEANQKGYWKFNFTTGETLTVGDPMGNVSVQVNSENAVDAACTIVDANTICVTVPMSETLDANPANGTTITVQAGQIGPYYTLTANYKIVYDAETWVPAIEGVSVTVTGLGIANVTNNWARFAGETASDVTISTSEKFVPVYQDAGVYINGSKFDASNGIEYIGNNTYHLDFSNIGTKSYTPQEDDIVTVKGVFRSTKSDIYLNFSEFSMIRTNQNEETTSWEKMNGGYEDFYRVSVKSATATHRTEDWLIRFELSAPLETTDKEAWSGLGALLSITFTTAKGEEKTLSPEALRADPTECLGIVIADSKLDSDLTGSKLTINPSRFSTETKTYKITRPCTLKYEGGTWVVDTSRPTASGVRGDATGDGVVKANDLVRALREYQGVEGAALCTADGAIEGMSKVTKSDTIRIREILLQGTVTFNAAGDATGLPVYLDDEYIAISAYRGPRSKTLNKLYDDDGKEVTNHTIVDYITDEEFQRYAGAGFNTLLAEGDAPFVSSGGDLMNGYEDHWTNLQKYMDCARKAGLDVFVTSEALNAYLQGVQAKQNDTGNLLDVTDDFLTRDLTQLFTKMKDYDNFKGLTMSDELPLGSYAAFAKASDIIESLNPDVSLYTNLLSMSNEDESAYANIGKDFANYVKMFGNATHRGGVAYDLYPLRREVKQSGYLWNKQYDYESGNQYLDTYWLQNLELSATTAKENDYEAGITLQSMGMKNKASKRRWTNPSSKADIGYQVYTSLAYGMKTIQYFTYWESPVQNSAGEIYTQAMIQQNADGTVTETPIYGFVQSVNNEITKFDHVFLDYDWQGTLYSDSGTGFTGVDTTYTTDKITLTSASQKALVGCMKDTDKGFEGYWIVNAVEPQNTTAPANTVKVTFSGKTKALLYNPAAGIYGELINLESDGSYTATLNLGEAQFIIPIV